MNISPLQKFRLEYSPKLPGMLRHGINEICVKEGEETCSVADQEKIKTLFPNTYGKKEITFEKLQAKDPCEIIRHAVKGMMPNGRLGRQMYKKFKVYAGPDHNHAAQKPEVWNF